MANFYRVIRSIVAFFIGVALVAWPMLSRAETISATASGYLFSDPTYWPTPSSVAVFSEGYCKAYLAAKYSNRVYTGYGRDEYWLRTSHIQYCYYTENGVGGSVMSDGVTVTGGYVCPENQNWTLTGSTCTRPDCLATETRQGDGTCKSNCIVGVSAGSSSSVYTSSVKVSGNTLCVAGCTVTADTCASGATGGSACLGPFVETGTSCVPASTTKEATPDTPEYKCAKTGQCSGTVNGVAVCVPCQTSTSKSTSSDKKTQTDKNPDGSSSGSGSSSSTDESTTCENGVCTTKKKTTTTNPDGSSSVVETEEQKPQTDFCKENANLAICKEGSFSGSCAAGAAPSCTGDAVQCAQAEAAWKIQCDLSTEPDSEAFKLGKTLSSGGADPNGNPLSAENTKEISVSGIVSDAIGERSLSSQCISSPSFSVAGRSYTLDVTQFCQFASIIGYLMVAASSVIAIRMVTSGA